VSLRATQALALLAIDPAGLRGLWLRARAGPVRDAVLAALTTPLPQRRLHPGIADDALYGGLDLAATLAAGRQVHSPGLLHTPVALILTMAERTPPGLAARLATALDTPGHCLIALDEGTVDETLPAALADRLALFLDLSDVVWSEDDPITLDPATLARARARLPRVTMPKDAGKTLTRAAASLGIASLRAPSLALAAARAAAAWRGGDCVTDEDLRLAATLVYAHRAIPAPDTSPPPPEPETTPNTPTEPREQQQTDIPEDILIDAARAALPADLIAALNAGRMARAAKGASGTGAATSGNRRGRPLPSRAGRIGTGARIDLVATLRAAAPWQGVRRRAIGAVPPTPIPSPRGGGEASGHARPANPPTRHATALQATPSPQVGEGWGGGASHAASGAPLQTRRLHIRPADIRLKRYVETSDRVLIFTVDASGSAAFARLAEAKGAVELLLAAAYARRDHVALIAFRGAQADLILPPTRSLVQTKRRLAGLPGGGGTPLAHGLQCAMATATRARARGLTPTIALLTDGRGNIALSGQPDRAQADTDATLIARTVQAAGLSAVVIDTGTRPQPALAQLARAMAAPYLALPRADAHRLSAVLGQAIA
jgi:magnesium chelatase subunit D